MNKPLERIRCPDEGDGVLLLPVWPGKWLALFSPRTIMTGRGAVYREGWRFGIGNVAPELWPCGHEKVRHDEVCRECSP